MMISRDSDKSTQGMTFKAESSSLNRLAPNQYKSSRPKGDFPLMIPIKDMIQEDITHTALSRCRRRFLPEPTAACIGGRGF